MNKPTVITETDDFLVLAKPAGISVHGDGVREVETLADWLVEQYPSLKTIGEPLVLATGETLFRPGIVHRLDKETSGVMVISKTQEFFEYLKQEFKERRVEKEYRAFVYGVVKQEEGVIDFPIGRSRKDFRLRSAQPKAKGNLREALTEYRVLRRGAQHTYLTLKPRTGRMHQIRVHLKAIHHPVIADVLYAPNHPKDLGFERLALHAYKISFALPSGERVSFEAPFPDDFVEAERLLG